MGLPYQGIRVGIEIAGRLGSGDGDLLWGQKHLEFEEGGGGLPSWE